MCDAFQQQPCLADAMIDMSQILSLVHPTSGCKEVKSYQVFTSGVSISEHVVPIDQHIYL